MQAVRFSVFFGEIVVGVEGDGEIRDRHSSPSDGGQGGTFNALTSIAM